MTKTTTPKSDEKVSEPQRPSKKGVKKFPAKPRTFEGGGTTEVQK